MAVEADERSVLAYIRALRHRYPGMDIDEITRLAKQIVYEAFRRHVEVNTPRKLRKFTWLVTQCELIEADDTPEYFRPRCSLFLPQGSITIQALRAGWHTWENFNLLRQRASIEAMCEMQTILSLSTPATENTITAHLRTYQQYEPAALRADAAAAAAEAAEAQAAADEAALAEAAEAAQAAAVPETAAVEPAAVKT